MSQLADLQAFLDYSLCDTEFIEDFDIDYGGPVNDLPDKIQITLFLKKETVNGAT